MLLLEIANPALFACRVLKPTSLLLDGRVGMGGAITTPIWRRQNDGGGCCEVPLPGLGTSDHSHSGTDRGHMNQFEPQDVLYGSSADVPQSWFPRTE